MVANIRDSWITDSGKLVTIDEDGNVKRYLLNNGKKKIEYSFDRKENKDSWWTHDGRKVVLDDKGSLLLYQKDGKALMYSLDKNNHLFMYKGDGKPIACVKDDERDFVWYDKNGRALTVDRNCNLVKFRQDSEYNLTDDDLFAAVLEQRSQKVTYDENETLVRYHVNGNVSYTESGDGKFWYRKDGKTLEFHKSPDGFEASYRNDGSVFRVKDRDGVLAMFRANGTLRYMRDTDGNQVWYCKNGRTVKFMVDSNGNRRDCDGIEDNYFARKRREFAKKYGLESVRTPKVFRQAEAFFSAKKSR